MIPDNDIPTPKMGEGPGVEARPDAASEDQEDCTPQTTVLPVGDTVPTTTSDGRFSFTTFASRTKTQGKRRQDRTWKNFYDKAVAEAPADNGRAKEDLPGWSPATFEGDKRSRKAVELVYALALDFDGKTLVTIDDAVAAWPGCLQIVHTSYSHATECPRFRQILPYPRPVTGSEHESIWEWAAERLRGRNLAIDESCRDASRLWFLPVRRESYEHRWVDGNFLDVVTILEFARRSPPPRENNSFEVVNDVPMTTVARALGIDISDPVCPWCGKTRDKGNDSQIAFGVTDANLYKCQHGKCAKSTNCVGLIAKVVLKIDDAKGLQRQDARRVLEWAREHLGIAIGKRKGQPVRDDRTDLPQIEVGFDHMAVNDRIIEALAREPNLYVRGNMLARAGRGALGQPILSRVSLPTLREVISAHVKFVSTSRGNLAPCHPPQQNVEEVLAREAWSGLRSVEGIIEYPVLRPDGTILDAPGYDETTRLIFQPNGEFERVPEHPTLADAKTAVAELADVFCDFPFEEPRHRSGALAGVLTPFARFAYRGCTPITLVTANTTRTGKGLLVDTTFRMVTGRDPVHGKNGETREEQAKHVSAVIREGHPLYLIDNIQGRFGGATWEAVLTSEVWSDRVLGVSETFTALVRTIFYATGNNVEVSSDMNGRLIHIRLHTNDEHPEARTKFRHDPLGRYVIENRPRLVRAALTVLRAYVVAGCPDQHVRLGAFDGWASLVASALVWCGLPDPVATQKDLADGTGSTLVALRALMSSWRESLGVVANTEQVGHKASEVIALLKSDGFDIDGDDVSIGAAEHGGLRDAIIEMCGRDGKLPTSVAFGKVLARHRDRVVSLQIDQNTKAFSLRGAVDRKGVTRWSLVEVCAGDAGDCRGLYPDNPGIQMSYERSTSEPSAGDAGDDLQCSREKNNQHESKSHAVTETHTHLYKRGESNPGIPGKRNETPCGAVNPHAGVGAEAFPAPSPASRQSPADADDHLTAEEAREALSAALRSAGLADAPGSPVPLSAVPDWLAPAPGIYAAEVLGINEMTGTVDVSYVGRWGRARQRISGMTHRVSALLAASSELHNGKVRIQIRENGQHIVWPMEVSIDQVVN